jgi:hypothetical protein
MSPRVLRRDRTGREDEMIRFALAFALLAAPAVAQDWETFSAGSRIGAGICPRAMSHADDGTYCLSVICDGGEGPFLDLSFLGFGGLPDRADVRVEASGAAFGGPVDAATEGRVTVYRLELGDAARTALRRGVEAGATVSETGGEPLLDLTFPLAGSSAGIERAGALCDAVRERSNPEEPIEQAVYSAAEVESELVDRALAWAGTTTRLAGDGTAMRLGGETGRWHIEGTDRVCLTFDGAETTCFRFYREGGDLRVRRSDAGADETLGTVEVGE